MMRRWVIIFFAIAMLGMISLGLPALAQPAHAPHENPATATGSLDEVAFLLSYSQIANLAASRQSLNAQEMLNELGHADIPEELRYIIDRYSALYRQLFTTLDDLEAALDGASALLDHNRIQEAKQQLEDTETDIRGATSLLADIDAATDTLSRELGVTANPMSGRLEESLGRLDRLLSQLQDLQHGLAERYVQTAALPPTGLSLIINPAPVFIGDSLTATGRLSAGGRPLAGRRLSLVLDNQPAAAAATAIDGSYAVRITIPPEYTDTMSLSAIYEPSGDDTGRYLASQSPPVLLDTRFYQSHLEVSAPETAHPGLTFPISGEVSSTGGPTDRTVSVRLDDTRLAEENVRGHFRLEVTPPAQLPPGEHSLSVSVTPRGRYSGASENLAVNVSRLPIYIDSETTKLVVLPGTVRVSGRVYAGSGPVPDAVVSIQSGGASVTARTARDGSFTASVRTPLDLSLASQRGLTMTVTPAEPWYTSTEAKRPLFIVNPLGMELLIAAMLALWILADMGSLMRRREKTGVPRPQFVEMPAVTPAAAPGPRLTGIKGRIISAYRAGLEAVERLSGISLGPSATLREFLKTAALPTPAAIRQFAELTAIAEITLYSPRRLSEDTAARAEKIAAGIKEELRRGTP